MPYGRRTYGTKRRTNRTYRKKSRTLRNSNILTRKSAAAQSRQILALKRKVNAIAYANKPELKVFDSIYKGQLPYHRTFDNSALSRTHDAWRMAYPEQGVEAYSRIGDTFKVISHTWSVNMQYSNDSSTGFHANMPSCACIRLIVVQFKSETIDINGVPPIGQIFSAYHMGGTNFYKTICDSPFIPGFSNEHRCLYDKKFYLTPDKPVKDVNVTVKPKHNLINLPMDPHGDGAETTNPESKNLMALYMVVGGLEWDANFKEKVDISINRKLVFTDA